MKRAVGDETECATRGDVRLERRNDRNQPGDERFLKCRPRLLASEPSLFHETAQVALDDWLEVTGGDVDRQYPHGLIAIDDDDRRSSFGDHVRGDDRATPIECRFALDPLYM